MTTRELKTMTTEPPKGLALFVRKIIKSRMKSPQEFAKLCADNGLKWIVFATIWYDVTKAGKKQNFVINGPEIIADYAQAMSEEGIKAHIWGYPWHDRINEFVEQIARYLSDYIVGILLDPELGLKKHIKEAEDLFNRVRFLNPYLYLGMSSYGLPAGHRSFPFEAFSDDTIGNPMIECDYGCPQLYDLSQAQILTGLNDWSKLGFDHIIPAFGLYKNVISDGKRHAVSLSPIELESHLMKFVESHVPIHGAIGWAENFMTPGLWNVLLRWAKVFESGGTIQSVK